MDILFSRVGEFTLIIEQSMDVRAGPYFILVRIFSITQPQAGFEPGTFGVPLLEFGVVPWPTQPPLLIEIENQKMLTKIEKKNYQKGCMRGR